MLSHGVQGWRSSQHCSGVVTGQHRSLTYLSGDALTDSRDCLGPGGQRYPHEEVDKFVRQQSGVRGGSSRQGRAMNLGNLSLYLPKSISRRKAYNWVTYYRMLCLKAIACCKIKVGRDHNIKCFCNTRYSGPVGDSENTVVCSQDDQGWSHQEEERCWGWWWWTTVYYWRSSS